ncbi:UNVERIFIED_CONTAM: hypothetical protein GTU68_033222 [Idotea baltica]|nr:hypothetical protein [Idotea baltica]
MSTQAFSKEELERYSRHIIIPEFNLEGQAKLKQARVLVVGAGGLGAPLLQYLAAAGVGHLGIVDFDRVEDHNLQRQVLFGVEDIGRLKVEAAQDRILALNPYIVVKTYNTRLSSENALEIIQGYDLVADGTDNFPTRYLVNDACVLLDKVNVYGSIFRFDGQVSVFNFRDPSSGIRGPNYRDLYPAPPPPGMVPSCAEGGVLGVLPGIIGSLQASEVIKVITGIGTPLSGRLFIFDALTFATRTLKFQSDPDNPISGDLPTQTGLIDYEYFCGLTLGQADPALAVREITVLELERWRQEGEDFQLIDVREPYEYGIVHLSGELIPVSQIQDQLEKISKTKKVVFHCRSGKRSEKVVRDLSSKGFDNVYNLKGGVLAYIQEVNPELPRY